MSGGDDRARGASPRASGSGDGCDEARPASTALRAALVTSSVAAQAPLLAQAGLGAANGVLADFRIHLAQLVVRTEAIGVGNAAAIAGREQPAYSWGRAAGARTGCRQPCRSRLSLGSRVIDVLVAISFTSRGGRFGGLGAADGEYHQDEDGAQAIEHDYKVRRRVGGQIGVTQGRT